jgi:hypothetical protein
MSAPALDTTTSQTLKARFDSCVEFVRKSAEETPVIFPTQLEKLSLYGSPFVFVFLFAGAFDLACLR